MAKLAKLQKEKTKTRIEPLKPEALYLHPNPGTLGFRTTADLEEFKEIIGQPRAVEAMRFGIGMRKEGYNIFAFGAPGTGKRTMVRKYFTQQAQGEPVPTDWIYVHNFDHAHKPNAISLPAGKGLSFQHDMSQFIEELQTSLTSAFESDEYRTRRKVVEEEIQERQEKVFEEMQKQAQEKNLALLRTPGGLVFAPVRDGEVMPPEEFQKLPADIRHSLEQSVSELQAQLQQVLQMVPIWQREVRQKIQALNREITTFAVSGLMGELRDKYASIEEISEFLDATQNDIIENASGLLSAEESSSGGSEETLAAILNRVRQESSPFRRYQVNLLVDHHATEGAPVIVDDNPTYQNLMGRVEYQAQMGALITDITLIKPGSLHLANGGYLILDARKVLQQPYSWEALKNALRSRQIRIESLSQMLGAISTVSLEPEPIPLNLKVALVGDRLLYYLLAEADPEFNELFKVQVDFEELMPRDGENQELYAQVIASLARKQELKPLDQGAVARVIEHSARLADDSEKLSVQLTLISDLLCEADFWAKERGSRTIQVEDIQQAIEAKIYRSDRIRERIQENILRDTILISTEGDAIGQINGLSVLQMGELSFGIPSRITARVHRGKGDVVNIEREVEMSGPIHSKGVLILSGFLGARYAAEHLLSLSASLVFEQSYNGVEGDSASSAELYALLSALAETPINQSFAVTGSVSQHGLVQAIGGVNEKIEGFFDICNARGLTGKQGVLIPQANVKNLMLRTDVVDAVANNMFNVYPISTIDEGIEILTGISAGTVNENGEYPPDSINGRVQARLTRLAEQETIETNSQEETNP